MPLARSLSAFTPEIGKNSRAQTAFELRKQAALTQSERPIAAMIANGDENSLPSRIACFVKGLPQNQFGEVDPAAYNALLAALKSGKHSDFERIPRGGGRKLNNPQSAFTFHLEGGDPHTYAIPAAPSIASPAASSETSELYWQALCRDVPFLGYETSPIIGQAAKHLATTPSDIFRGPKKSDLAGPYVSQFT